MKVFDCFMLHDELDMLECRLVELDRAVDRFVIVEADVTHQDTPKPSYFLDHRERFSAWLDRIIHVRATGLPTVADNPDPWAREHAQREWIAAGLTEAARDDIVLQSDVDEIPTAVAARNVRPRGLVAFEQRLFCFAVDWEHPETWCGTVAARAGDIVSFGAMRDTRNTAPRLPGAGWHLSWLGGRDQNLKKLGAFCHPEIAGRTLAGIQADEFLGNGWHVDGKKLRPVDVDSTWPRWIAEGHCPVSWYRPRGEAPDEGWRPPTGLEAVTP